MKLKQVRNLKQLTTSLSQQYNRLLSGEISVEQADATSKMAATIIGACKVQMDYNRMTDNQERIEFLSPHEAPTIAQKVLGNGTTPAKVDWLAILRSSEQPMTCEEMGKEAVQKGLVPANTFDVLKVQRGGAFPAIRLSMTWAVRSGKATVEKGLNGSPAKYSAVEVHQGA